MVKTNRRIISVATLLSGVATTFLLVSLVTEQWVKADGKLINYGTVNKNTVTLSTIKYGLFSGTFAPQFEDSAYEIKMTCLISDNACAYLCETSAERRKSQLKRLVKGENVTFNKGCPHVLKEGVTTRRFNDSINYLIKSGNQREFLNAGLYISTNIFLGISLLFGSLSTVLSIWIIATNPIEISLSIYAVYTYDIVACVSSVLTLILWGILFRVNAINNVGILYTIQGQMDTSGMVNLGFSYWLMLPSSLFYLISTIFLHLRQHPISPELDATILTYEENKIEKINYEILDH